jgi:hypothetical protein
VSDFLIVPPFMQIPNLMHDCTVTVTKSLSASEHEDRDLRP